MRVCTNCAFYRSLSFTVGHSREPDSGECRRKAPSLNVFREYESMIRTYSLASFPLVLADDWCGEFEPRAREASTRAS